jgi:hypothetical protein
MFEYEVLAARVAEITPTGYDQSLEIKAGLVYLVDAAGANLPPVAL